MQLKNALSRIDETFDGIKNSSMLDSENAFYSIVCKLEFGDISTFSSSSQ